MTISGPGVSSYTYIGVSGPGVSSAGVSDLLPSLDLNFLSSDVLDSRITFTRGSQATLFDSAGTLRYAKHNLLLQSQDFATTWLNSGSTEQTDVATAPDGTTTADSLTDTVDGVNTTHLVQQAFTFVSGVQYTFSVYAKADTLPGIQLLLPSAAFGADQRANYDCTNGTVSNVAGTATLSIISVGNGWYRCLMTATSTAAGSASLQIRLIKNVSGSLTSFYIGDGTGKSLIWGAQLNLSNMEGGVTSSLTTYYPTTTAAYYGPRFDYNPSTLAARGLLIEEARTNSIRNNTMQGAVVGVVGSGGALPTNWSTNVGGLSRQIVAIGTQDGINYIDIKYSGTTTTTGSTLVFFENNNVVAALNGQTWTGSCWLAIVGGSFANLTVANVITRFNDASGAILTSSSSSFAGATSSLNRYSIASTASNASTAFVTTTLAVSHANGAAIDITLRIGLPQLELGAFATSVIPTTTTALTRNADVASMTGTNFSSWYNAVEGTVVSTTQLANTVAANRAGYDINDNSTSNRIIFRGFTTGGGDQATIRSGGSTVFQDSNAVAPTTAARKTAIAYKVNDFVTVANAGTPVTDASGAVPVSPTQILIGSAQGSTEFFGGYIQRISYYPSRLPNGTLQALTA